MPLPSSTVEGGAKVLGHPVQFDPALVDEELTSLHAGLCANDTYSAL